MKTCFAYLRVSGRDQVFGDGFTRQETAVKAYCAAHGVKLVKIYREQISGTTESMDRPVWTEMITAILSNGIDVVLVESLGRLSRQLFVQEYILRDLKQRGITLISATEPDLDSDPTRVMLRQIVGSVHEYERSMIVLKLRGARQRMKAATGRCEGQKPYGSLPGEESILERIRSLHKLPYATVAKVLNDEGLKPRSGIKWHPNSVRRILRAQAIS